MIVLHQFARCWDSPNLSSFCVKVETYLRMANIPHEIKATFPPFAPRGKLPFIVDGGKTIADSRLILQYLKQVYGDPLDAAFSPQQRAAAMAVQRLLEEHLYWAVIFSRWSYTRENWTTNKQAVFGGLPPGLRDAVAALRRRSMLRQIHGQGMGRMSQDEIFALGRQDIDALADFLADKAFFLGKTPTSLDASAYGLLVNTLAAPIDSPLKSHALTKDNLVAFCRRVQQGWFPEFPWRGPAPTPAAPRVADGV